MTQLTLRLKHVNPPIWRHTLLHALPKGQPTPTLQKLHKFLRTPPKVETPATGTRPPPKRSLAVMAVVCRGGQTIETDHVRTS